MAPRFFDYSQYVLISLKIFFFSNSLAYNEDKQQQQQQSLKNDMHKNKLNWKKEAVDLGHIVGFMSKVTDVVSITRNKKKERNSTYIIYIMIIQTNMVVFFCANTNIIIIISHGFLPEQYDIEIQLMILVL